MEPATNLALSETVRAQHGLITLAQARELGLSDGSMRQRVANNTLVRVERGLYRHTASPSTWRQRQLAACLIHGPEALTSHRAAALLWQLNGIDHAPLELSVPRWMRHRKRPNITVHESLDLEGNDRTTVDGLPCTSIIRTMVDLPAVVPFFRADQAFEDALRRRLCTVEQVLNRFVRVARRGRNGTVAGRQLLEKRTGDYVPTMSEFERLISDLVVDIELPMPERQVRVDLPDGPAYIDLGWSERLLGIECDGMFNHADNVRLPWDEQRQNELILLGWFILRFTWEQLRSRRGVVVRQIREAYSRRSP